jgi:signal recognition particle subunit SRP54
MFQNLSERLTGIVKTLSGQGRLTEKNISDSLQEVRISLLEADVALPVVTKFIDDVKEKALGAEVLQSLRPGDAFIKIVYDELISVLGNTNEPLNLNTTPPAIIMMVGLQGSGKTTTTAKLANLLKTQQKKSVLLTSTDVYRPAAMEQLQTLAQQLDIAYFNANDIKNPVEIARQAIHEAKRKFIDVVIIDTAGRLHIDDTMMTEAFSIQQAANPIETLLIVDSMMGQDAVNTAKAFNEKLSLTGIILTKTDGDARGGAALSMRLITGKPIKFVGVGEKIDELEVFYPDRIASRILDMGDILSLVEEAERKIDRTKAEKLAKKIHKEGRFDFEDFLEQLKQLRNMGGITNLISKLPGMGNLQIKKQIDDKMFVKMESIINSMTLKERHFPALIKGSRKKRIADGSGTQVQDVNKLLKQFEQMQKMMKRFKGGRMAQMMQQMSGTGM